MSQRRISNEGWDAGRMLAKALRGRYPSAMKSSQERPAEIAYWRGRCEAQGIDPAPIVAAYERTAQGRR